MSQPRSDVPDIPASPPRADGARDPRPVPPERPLASDCCDSGCEVCVYDFYAEELDQYRRALAEWEARNPGAAAQG